MAHDLRLAFRQLTASPGFSIVAILTLALGIGLNAALFSVVDGVLLRPAPVEGLERLVMVWETDRFSGTTREPASVPDFLDFQARAPQLDTLAAFQAGEVNATADSGDPERLARLSVSQGFLPMLGIQPIVGRLFHADEDVASGPQVVLISESLWTRRFGRTPDITGRTIRVDDVAHGIVGVVSDTADFGVLQVLAAGAYARAFVDRGVRTRVDVWMPLQADPESAPRETHGIFLLGRLAPGRSASDAQHALTTVAADLERQHRVNAGRGVFIEPLDGVVFGPSRPALLVLLGAVLLVLLVACVNVANLLLARGAARSREMALRAALGATRRGLARQFLVETLLLTTIGAAAGLALAWIGLRTLIALAPAEIPRLAGVAIDGRVLGATLAISMLVAIVFSLVPLWQAAGLDLHETLTNADGPRGSASRHHARVRGALVVAELAFAVVLVVGAGLLLRSLWQLQRVDPGFRATGVLKAEYQLPRTRYPVDFRRWPDFAEMHAFTGAIAGRAAALPGVTAVAVAGDHPLAAGFTNSFVVEGREAESDDWPEISVRRVTPGYFTTVDVPLLRGRRFAASDTSTAAPVALINDAAARRFFGQADPIGARIRFWGSAKTIVGVIGNERFHGLTTAAPVAVYLPLAQAPSANGAGVLLVRTSGDPMALTSAVRAVVREVDPQLAVFGVEPLDDTLSRASARHRFTMLLLTVFAGVALALAVVGVHGVLSHAVARRTREIGIRVALGARPSGVLGLVMRQGLVLVGLGLLAGLTGAFVLSRWLASLLFGVTAADPLTYAGVVVVLLTAAALAMYLPTRRALAVDPVTALRAE